MLPVFAIVGRPNVGKSTLYNRLTKTRDAIVGDMPGVTRDRHYGIGKSGARSFIVVDTGGIAEPDDQDMARMTQDQANTAMDEADVILFMVDALAGIANGDWAIAKQLRCYTEKKIVLVVNKSDRELVDVANAEFYSLGFKNLFSIAASSGRGIESMVAALIASFPDDVDEAFADESDVRTRIAVLGRPNVGKSTLINRLFGEERVLVFDRPGTTRDSISIPYERHGKKYTLIDTAGIRRRTKVEEGIEIFSVIKAMQAMKQAHVVIVVIDAREGLTDQDMRLIGLVVEAGSALVLAFNKWDNMEEDVREQFKRAVDRRLPFAHFARRYYISAKHGTGVGMLYDAVDETQEAMSQPFATHELTKILMAATEDHQPPLAQGRRVKLRYAHVGSKRPLTFVVHGKQVNKLPGSYKQYLVNYFRDKLNLVGIPLVVKFVGDDNPFVDAPEK
ncbi:MAG: ribosome biogenesis GTPase Der [Gammaproteobacteria bacterium CG_4_10_14_0_8_um_filter_38_16]|nr:MAG: ribosome biogenesis GTPase Der [Gammaproteobacteria bacterium CG_4_10_14_0_8_um_filter_38_16]PJA03053.1 MAG: ribosome biogenesis GTPase Der [Gammaproteobacteria bacterium CG_4_10_14_0_2_um_filter_38_22]PJB10217.1 MAG: ribosome biogenesis GTPase Der [Gammaproteobacteria bacterium CG_4_9_14_3_um_filter_38_9]